MTQPPSIRCEWSHQASRTCPIGVGKANHHHGEVLQGVIGGRPFAIPCLVTFPTRKIGSVVRYVADETYPLRALPEGSEKAARAALLTLKHLGLSARGHLEVRCAVRPGVGLGSSTSDVVAAIRAVSNAFDTQLSALEVAVIAVEAEVAADPVMFEDEVVLFAQRHGQVLESWGRWFPAFTVLSVLADPDAAGIATVSLPVPGYTSAELSWLETLISNARIGFQQQDGRRVAAVATASAELNQRFQPIALFEKIRAVAKEQGALGVQISHSGTVIGVLFDSSSVPLESELVTETVARLESVGAMLLGRFTTGC
jgi:uncharacterized protein involved in propanediol utilization